MLQHVPAAIGKCTSGYSQTFATMRAPFFLMGDFGIVPQLLTLFKQENFTVGTVFNLFALCATNHIKSKFGTSWQEAIAEFMGTP